MSADEFRGAAARSTSLRVLFPFRMASFLLVAPFALFVIAACGGAVSTPVTESDPLGVVESQRSRRERPDANVDATADPLAGLLTHDYIDLDAIARISRFRSGVGHDYPGGGETCRNMKHYFEPRADLDWSRVSLYAPAAGQIDSVETEWAGDKLNIALAAAPEIVVTIFHVRREPGLEPGSSVVSGQKLGHHIGPQTMSDIAVHDRSRDHRPLSYFELLGDSVLDAYRARGLTGADAAIIPRAQRDADALRCAGEHGEFLDPPRADDWLVLEDAG